MTLASEGLSLPSRLHSVRYDDPDRKMAPDDTPALPDGVTVDNGTPVGAENPDDGDDNGLIVNDDGSITVVGPKDKPKKEKSSDFDANLAEELDDMTVLNTIASDLLEAVQQDDANRKEWQETMNKGLDLCGLKIETPTSDVSGGGGNISKAKDSLLLEAVLRYQSNFNAEMLPADGPVKIRDDQTQLPPGGAGGGTVTPPAAPPGPPAPGGPPPGAPPQQPPVMGMAQGGPMGGPGPVAAPPNPNGGMDRASLAEAFQKDFNHYLTVVDKPYYADTDRMSFSQGLSGCAFKKIYRDPIENRPVSRFVMAANIIVDNGASSLHDAKRITHEIPNMSKVVMKKMMMAGAYRDIPLSQPTSDPGPVDAKIKETEGTAPGNNTRPEDKDHYVYEVYCYLDLEGYEHKDDDGEPSGMPLPYRVTIEKDSREVLEIRRDWKEGDKNYKRRRHFVKFPLFPGLGFYDYGFVHVLGNTTRVLSAIESLCVDQGMFANFPGGLIDKMASRQEKNQIRPGPGGFLPIDTGGRPINQVVMGMPYKDVSQNLLALATGLKADARKLGQIAELPLGEGRADVPVGTVVALIEQNTKLLSAVHKRNHAAQQEEFEILKELFMEDPSALWKFAEKPNRLWESEAEMKDVNLVPASDPNISSHVMRIMRSTACLQILQQAPPGLLNPKEILTRAFRAMGEEDIDALFLPPVPPQQTDPNQQPHVLDAQAKQAQIAAKAKSDDTNAQVKLRIAAMEQQNTQMTNQTQTQIANDKLRVQAMKDVHEFAAGNTPPASMAPDAGGRPQPGI